MKYGLILLILCWAEITPLLAADTPSTAPQSASTPITDPALVAQHYHQVLSRPEFQQVDETDVNTRFKEWLSQWFKRLGVKFGEFEYANDMPAFASLVMTLLAILSLAGLIYIMMKLTRRRARMEMESSSTASGVRIFRSPEFYEDEIQQAVTAGDWHTAWLAAWRQFLSRLENRNLVEADRTRTNREYLAQLRALSMPEATFSLLSGMVDAYDRYVYGRQIIGEPEWKLFRGHLNEAALMLHLDEKRSATRIQQENA